MIRLIGYVRVSTEEQSEHGVSLDDQKAKIRAYADLVDGKLLHIIEDGGYSGSNLDRPGVKMAINLVLEKGDSLVVYAIDRLSRSTFDFLDIVKKLRTHDKGFVSVREQMDSSTPHGRFTMTILAALAEMERELISIRTKEALARCAVDRRIFGKLPYGFTRHGKDLIEDPREVAIIRQIQQSRECGLAYHLIADHLNTSDVPTKNGKRWFAATVRSVFRTAEKLNVH